jgi:hypothetical protein
MIGRRGTVAVAGTHPWGLHVEPTGALGPLVTDSCSVWSLRGQMHPKCTWFSPLLALLPLVPSTHVAIVDVEDVHFGRRFDFLYTGTVPAMVSWAELKGQPGGPNLPGALTGDTAFPAQSLWVSQRAVHGLC